MQRINSRSITEYFVTVATISILVYLVILLHKPPILSLLFVVGGVFLLIYSLVPDKWIIYTVFFSYVFYLDFLFKAHDLFEAILPVSFLILLFRRLLKRDIAFHFIWKRSWPFLLYFSIGLFWFTQTGEAPTIITGKDVMGVGNFSRYYNMFLNMLAFLVPFIAVVKVRDLEKLLKLLLFFFIVQAIVMTVFTALGKSFYIPVVLPFQKGLIDLSSSEVMRIGAVGNVSFLVILYIVFWGDMFPKYIKSLIIISFLIINIVYGGGRCDLASSIFILVFVDIIRSKKLNFGKLFKNFALFILIVSVLLVSFNVLAKYMAPKQQERFAEIINLKKAYERRVGGDNTRVEMWRYVFREGLQRPLLGHGISSYWEWESRKFQTGAIGLVSTGSAHNKYISIFYSFGAIGLLLFLLGSKDIFRKLMHLRKEGFHILWDFFLMYFVVAYLRFLIEGGVTGQAFMFFFFIGYILSYRSEKVENSVSKSKILDKSEYYDPTT